MNRAQRRRAGYRTPNPKGLTTRQKTSYFQWSAVTEIAPDSHWTHHHPITVPDNVNFPTVWVTLP